MTCAEGPLSGGPSARSLLGWKYGACAQSLRRVADRGRRRRARLGERLHDDGATWTGPIVLSNRGVNYFPTISVDRTYATDNVAAAWFTNSFDLQFENAQDVVATSINPRTGESRGLKRLTSSANEPEADPLLGGFFIGDYIEGVLIKNRYYVHTNANYRKLPLLGGFANAPNQPVLPVNQQDNYLFITAVN